MLMAVPNVSEGIDAAVIEKIGDAFAPAYLLDVHSDPDHHRSVFTLAGREGELADALTQGTKVAQDLTDITSHDGIHPHVGAVDVVPLVYLTADHHEAAQAEAIRTAEMIAGETETPVFLYGELAGGRSRSEIRKGGPKALAERIARGELTPDYGPGRIDPKKGATLVGSRPPLVAFNVDLAGLQTPETAKAIAAELRESGGGLAGVEAIGLWLPERGLAQVSCNVHDPLEVPLEQIVKFVQQRAPIEHAELVGLAPRAAFKDFPSEVEILGFDPLSSVIELRLESLPG